MVDSVDRKRQYHFISPHSGAAGKQALRKQSLFSIKDAQETIIEPRYSPPFRRYDGMWTFADGEFWNPGFGRGMYYWDSQQPIGVFKGDGIQYGTIPTWVPTAGYVIDFGTVLPVLGSLGTLQFLISGLVGFNVQSYVQILGTGQILFHHAQNHPSQFGEVTSANALTEDVAHSLAVFVTTSSPTVGEIAIVLDGIETRDAFTYRSDVLTANYTHLFTDSAAPGTNTLQEIIISGVGMTDLQGALDRFYPFDDDIIANPNVFRDTGGTSQDGTWVNQSAGNHITQLGAWIPVNNLRVETT